MGIQGMSYEIKDLPQKEWPELLHQMPDPPKSLRLAGTLSPKENKLLAVVGSRAMTPYGKEAVDTIISWLRGTPVTVVSGLALGVDTAAHRSALRNNLHTIAVPGSGLSQRVMYPSSHAELAKEIVEAGGALISEFEDELRAAPWTFPQRNRIMAGMSHATLIIEAKEASGSLITARLAIEYNRDVGVVPGSIFSPHSQGVNKLLKDGAQAIVEKDNLYALLGLKVESGKTVNQQHLPNFLTPEENEILDYLKNGSKETDEIIENTSLSASVVLAVISSLSLKGLVKEIMGRIERIPD